MSKKHFYELTVQWTGNQGKGTAGYRAYTRDHVIIAAGKQDILASADPTYRGDETRYNPEELLLASLSSCHMLWFLHLCADKGISVTTYVDHPEGTMIETSNGSGKFTEVILKPIATVTDIKWMDKLDELHRRANEFCFIANSVNFQVKHHPQYLIG